ncbi:acyltransferase [Myxococcus sp. SDU36]|uniref:acyltransferase family protein n=1 Tax=Myxococcus sp. SDU36 TaxID=2831967 RepID=UPI0025435F64|nr:acyltransferase [Myxococcus sp. SDU36]
MKTGPTEPPHLPEYLPVLDGLRGVAVLMVISYHSLTGLRSASLGSLFQVGWAGVDLFFVLSGFLITRILVQTRARGGYFRTFYARRALRIWPLYFLVLVFTFGVMGRLLPALAFDTHRYAWTTYALYLQNLWMTDFGPAPINVTWSLAIEEQFYLVWPLLVFFLRNGQLRALLWACVLLSPAARLVALWEGAAPIQVYTFTLFRLDGLALGGCWRWAWWMAAPRWTAWRGGARGSRCPRCSWPSGCPSSSSARGPPSTWQRRSRGQAALRSVR